MSTLVYTRELSAPYLSVEFQKDTCSRWAVQKGFTDVTFSDTFSNTLFESGQHLIVYSVAVLGDTLEEIIKAVKRLIDSGVKIYAITEPIDFQNFGNDPQQNLLLSTCIGYALYQNRFWKQLV